MTSYRYNQHYTRKAMAMAIKFYTTKTKYGCFSNFSRHGFFLDGNYWPTSEHYYQSQKFAGTGVTVEENGKTVLYEDVIRNAPNPKTAADLGRDKTKPMRSDWDEVKDDVMRKVVMHKFTVHEACRKTLLETGEDELIEDSPVDWYWGCGSDGSGKNMLGVILMETRKALRKKYSPD